MRSPLSLQLTTGFKQLFTKEFWAYYTQEPCNHIILYICLRSTCIKHESVGKVLPNSWCFSCLWFVWQASLAFDGLSDPNSDFASWRGVRVMQILAHFLPLSARNLPLCWCSTSVAHWAGWHGANIPPQSDPAGCLFLLHWSGNVLTFSKTTF